jgi:hypothetical protein
VSGDLAGLVGHDPADRELLALDEHRQRVVELDTGHDRRTVGYRLVEGVQQPSRRDVVGDFQAEVHFGPQRIARDVVAKPPALAVGDGLDQPQQRGAGREQDPAELLLVEASVLLTRQCLAKSRKASAVSFSLVPTALL